MYSVIINKNIVVIMLSFIYLFIIQSPLISLLKIPGLLYIIAILGLTVLLKSKIKFLSLFTISFFFIIPTFILILYWQDIRLISTLIIMCTSIILYDNLSKRDVIQLIEIGSNFIIILCLLAYIGLFITFITNGNENFSLMLWGRKLMYFYTTFSVDRTNAFIRPSGIYMEPGHLAWIICSLIVCRELLSLNKNKTYFILLLGLVTFSLAYLFFLILFLLHSITFKNLLKIGFFSIIIALLFYVLIPEESLHYAISSRFEIDEHGNFRGDNRSFRFFNAWSLLNFESFFVGLGPDCFFNHNQCPYPKTGENPLAPIINLGLLSLWYYFALIIIFSSILLKPKFWLVIIGILLIYLQQPVLLQAGYSMWALLIIKLIYTKNEN